MKFKKHAILLVALLLVALVGIFVFITRGKPDSKISSFDECVARGNQVMESYPAQCRAKDGTVFVQDIGNELQMQDLIVVENPRPNQEVESPLAIKGRARGKYFFEGSFPLELTEKDGKTIAEGFASAQGEWMSEEFVPFSAEISFTQKGGSGELILKRDNPSEKPENDAALEIPVKFAD